MSRWFVCFWLLLVTTGCGWNPADARLRQHLGIPASIPLNDGAIRDAALRAIPPGSTETQVRGAVAKAGIGRDDLSRYIPPGEDGQAYIMVSLDPRTFGLVKREYMLTLHFDAHRRLKDISARSRWTGL
jgi:hypothetical protein